LGLVRTAVRLAADKKAHDPVVLDMAEAVGYTDYFVILSGGSARQAKAIADAVSAGLRAAGVRATHTEGEREAEWILIDYLDVIVHVFTPAARDFYRLEALWRDVPRVPIGPDHPDRVEASEVSRTG
jgi:ribosome-associated protein